MTKAKRTVERDWSFLFPEALSLIAKNLSEVSDFVRFRAVCKAWRSSTPITDLPPQFPWILVNASNNSDLQFSIPSNKFYTIHAPTSLSFLWGPAEGYILTYLYEKVGNSFTYQLSLLNPLSNHEIPLPAIHFGCTFPFFYAWKTQMGKKYLVCLVDKYISRKLDFWQLGQNNWRQLNLDPCYKRGRIFYLKNMFFMVEKRTGVTKAIDMGTGTLVYTIPPTEDYTTMNEQYMVEDSGHILRVIRHGSGRFLSEQFDVLNGLDRSL